MSLKEQNARAKKMFGPDATIEQDGRWHVLSVPGQEPLHIGVNDSECSNALDLAEAAGISALSDFMNIPNPSWIARWKSPKPKE